MRIDLYGPAATPEAIDQITKASTEKAATTKNQKPALKDATEDKTTLSSGSDSVTSLAKAALQPLPSRATKVEALKQAVADAQYKLDSDKIAESLSSADV